MKILDKESGFTLMEMMVVLAILLIFMTTITGVLFTSTKILKESKAQTDVSSDSSLALSHIEVSLKKYDARDAIRVVNIPEVNGNKMMLSILVKPMDLVVTTPLFLNYIHNATEKKIYACTNDSFAVAPTNMNCSVIAQNVSKFNVNATQSTLNTTLIKIEIVTDSIHDSTVKIKTEKLIALKAK